MKTDCLNNFFANIDKGYTTENSIKSKFIIELLFQFFGIPNFKPLDLPFYIQSVIYSISNSL